MSVAEIKYIDTPHPVTGVENAKLGIWLFLASEVMLFGALFSSYVLLRVGASEWPRGSEELNVPLATLNTIILITSSVTMVMSWVSLKMDNFGKFRMYLGATIALALAFLVIKGFEYAPKFSHYEVFLEAGTEIQAEHGNSIRGHIHDQNEESITFTPDPDPGHPHAHGDIHIDRDDIKRLTNFGPAHSNFFGLYFTLTGLHGLHIIGGILVNLWLMFPGSAMWKTQRDRFTGRIECAGLYWHFVDLVWIFLFPTLYLL